MHLIHYISYWLRYLNGMVLVFTPVYFQEIMKTIIEFIGDLKTKNRETDKPPSPLKLHAETNFPRVIRGIKLALNGQLESVSKSLTHDLLLWFFAPQQQNEGM